MYHGLEVTVGQLDTVDDAGDIENDRSHWESGVGRAILFAADQAVWRSILSSPEGARLSSGRKRIWHNPVFSRIIILALMSATL